MDDVVDPCEDSLVNVELLFVKSEVLGQLTVVSGREVDLGFGSCVRGEDITLVFQLLDGEFSQVDGWLTFQS